MLDRKTSSGEGRKQQHTANAFFAHTLWRGSGGAGGLSLTISRHVWRPWATLVDEG